MPSDPPVAVVLPGSSATWTRRPNRPSLEFRELGLARATGGTTMAQIVRAVAPGTEPQDPHFHEGVDLQFFHVIAGSMTVDYAGVVRTLLPGDTVIQPAGSVHAILEHSADLVLLEVTSPSEYTTVVATGANEPD
jgi:quercetin dioxygenase-like cupin family protein